MIYILGAGLLIFLGVVLFRTIRFTPTVPPVTEAEAVDFDSDRAVSNLAELVRCRTISCTDHTREDEAEFEKFIAKLPGLYPSVFAFCEFRQLPDRALLLRWPGKASDAPSVMMSHYDVVPVNEDQWNHPPFGAVIAEGCLWGRGTLDTKATLNGALFAADHLIAQGFQPDQDVYFAFSGGEEVNGKGALNIVRHFQEQGIEPALVLDEGGAVVENVFPGVRVPCGLIGIAEKGMMNVQFRAVSNGGHASAPKPHTPVGILARACTQIEDRPFPCHIQGPAAQMFDTLGRHASFGYRLLFANLWCFGWIIDLLGRLTGGDINALVRTTVAFTQMEGSSARNVIPPEAKMVANLRLNPADDTESVLARLRKIVADGAVEISDLASFEPSRVSRTDCEGWDRVAAAVAENWPGCVVSPYLMVQCADARHWGLISDRVYRFSAMDLTNEERATVHGSNERIRLETVRKTVEFYIRLLKKC